SLVVMQHNLDMTRVYQFLFETFPQRVLQCFETVVVRKGEIENRNPEFRLKNRLIIRQYFVEATEAGQEIGVPDHNQKVIARCFWKSQPIASDIISVRLDLAGPN